LMYDMAGFLSQVVRSYENLWAVDAWLN